MFPKPKNYCKCGCETVIPVTKKWVSGHNLKRRPKDAIVKNGRLYKEIKCSECSGVFERRTDQVNRHGLNNYCSRECLSVRQSREKEGKILPNARNGEYRKCRNCHKENYVSPTRSKRFKSIYCSQECQTEYQRKTGIIPKGFISSADNSGENNGRYKHGKRIGGHTQKKILREMVIERDGGNWCLLCGEPGPGLHLHRIIYGAQGGEYELDNCVQLCPEHHEEVHSSKKKWKPHLLKLVKRNTESKLYE